MPSVKQQIKDHLPSGARRRLREVYGRLRPGFYPHQSWSQCGEDMILRDLFSSTPRGFYVDVGAFHPRFGSNTYALHRRGWSGINIDASPGSMRSFRKARPRDINLELAIGSVPGEATFHVFVEDELSTLDDEWAATQLALGHKLDRRVRVQVRTLADIHREHKVPARYELLSVDCEGRDADVLASNDWNTYRPRIIVIECSQGDLPQALDSKPATVVRERGYVPTAATRLSLILRDDGSVLSR
jgi:FkbM family methyltransferase